MKSHYSIKRLASALISLGAMTLCAPAAPESSVKSSESTPLNIDRAVRLALANNPELKAGDARRQAAAGRAEQARLWQNPELELAVEDAPLNSSGWAKSKHMAGISQSFPYPGKKRLDNEIGTADTQVGESDWRSQKAALARDVKIAFFRVLAAENEAQVAGDMADLAESLSEVSKKRTDAGDTALQEQLRAEIQMEQAKADHAEFLDKVAEQRRDLALLMGLQAPVTSRLAGSLDDSDSTPALKRGPDVWLESHPAMIAARAKCKLAGASARRAEVDHLPDPKIGIMAGRDEAADENLAELRLSFPLPIFDKGKARTKESQAGIAEADAELDATARSLIAGWNSARAKFKSAASQVSAHRDRILPKSEQALALVKAGYEEGKFSFIDLLDTERITAESRFSYQRKLFELNAMRAELESFTDPVPSR